MNFDKKAQVPDDNVIEKRSCSPDAVEYRKSRRSWSVKSLLGMSKTKISEDMDTKGKVQQTFRRILYNEGIDDRIASNFPMIIHRHPSPERIEKKSSRYLVTDGLIPCDHRRKSRYHYHCQEELNKKCYKLDNNFKYKACAEYHKDPRKSYQRECR
ncbi:unnamed protein product [Parnassius apollo]|uniref:(apollo) hypothetical protein n=1 Tax=Parnassius apollo TaxID=110799 RepID=A0A8S3W122_PARAO|nr:unnamed protein product [Parnassius apollo]